MPLLDNRDELEVALKRDILRLTEGQAERLMRMLGNPPDVANVRESFWRELENDLAVTLKEGLERAYVASAQQLLPTIPRVLRVDWHLVNQPAAQWAEQYSFELVKGITNTSQTKLQGYVSNFFKVEGTTNADLSGQVTTLFGEARADAITTTEITRAAAQGDVGIVNKIQEANPRMMLEPHWGTSQDEAVCPLCGVRGLQGVVGVMVGGQPVFKSRNGRTYGPPPDPHPGCRCDILWIPKPRGRR